MGNRLSKITTRTGDDGTTSLAAGSRLNKFDTAIEAIGTLDELNSSIGMVLALRPASEEIEKTLKQVQQDLFDLGGELCPPHHLVIKKDKILFLETMLEKWNATLPPLKEFILPGGNIKSATCHLARTICRRAERCLVKLHQEHTLNPNVLRYINRLSDLLFVAARVLSHETTDQEEMWQHTRKKQ